MLTSSVMHPAIMLAHTGGSHSCTTNAAATAGKIRDDRKRFDVDQKKQNEWRTTKNTISQQKAYIPKKATPAATRPNRFTQSQVKTTETRLDDVSVNINSFPAPFAKMMNPI